MAVRRCTFGYPDKMIIPCLIHTAILNRPALMFTKHGLRTRRCAIFAKHLCRKLTANDWDVPHYLQKEDQDGAQHLPMQWPNCAIFYLPYFHKQASREPVPVPVPQGLSPVHSFRWPISWRAKKKPRYPRLPRRHQTRLSGAPAPALHHR